MDGPCQFGASGLSRRIISITDGGGGTLVVRTAAPHNLAGLGQASVTLSSTADYDSADNAVTVIDAVTFSVAGTYSNDDTAGVWS